MPTWVQYIIYAAALVTAAGVIWKKVLRPMIRLVSAAEEMIPLLQELTAEFKDTPEAFKVLSEIADQFRTDSGSTLKDQVNRLEAAAERQEANAEHLKVGVEAQRLLAEQDRAELRALLVSLTKIDVKVEAGAATSLRNEEAALVVAQDLAVAHKAAEAANGEAGSAADAAAQQTKKEQLMEDVRSSRYKQSEG